MSACTITVAVRLKDCDDTEAARIMSDLRAVVAAELGVPFDDVFVRVAFDAEEHP
jgi:hypothetical protein